MEKKMIKVSYRWRKFSLDKFRGHAYVLLNGRVKMRIFNKDVPQEKKVGWCNSSKSRSYDFFWKSVFQTSSLKK
jgi:hypothetical protein